MRAFFLALVLAAGCDSGVQPAGGVCSTSEECAAGLLCDYGQTPHRCAGMMSAFDDLSVPPDDAGTTD